MQETVYGTSDVKGRRRTTAALLLGIALGVLGLMVIARQAAPSFWNSLAGPQVVLRSVSATDIYYSVHALSFLETHLRVV